VTAGTWTDRARPLVSGIVLAGGGSSRFGSDKLTAEIDGRSLLQHAIHAVAEITDEVVVVGSAQGGPELPATCRVPMRIARDATPDGGPLVGLIAGLEAARFPVAVVVGGDMPLLVASVLATLVERLGREAHRATSNRPEPPRQIAAAGLLENGRIRPLPCALRREPALALARATLAGSTSRLRSLLDALGVIGIPEAEWRLLDPGALSLFDVDSLDDLARARRARDAALDSPLT
jgi:molybdopterin-guanine dinucleotide biosynthesis protein A